MRKLLLFSLPFGLGALLCQYLIPDALRPWTALAFLLAGLGTAFLLKDCRRIGVRIGAVGLAAGILWFAGYTALYLNPAEALAGTTETVTLELLGYPEEASHGARCEVKILDPDLRGRAVYYGGYDLLSLEPGNRVATEAKFYSAAALSGSDSNYYTSRGVFVRLYGKGEAVISEGNAGALRYMPQRMAHSLKRTITACYEEPAAGLITALLTGDRDGLDAQSANDLAGAGLSHMVAVSGLHCGFLICLLGALVFRRQKLTAFLGYPVLLVYMVMVGCTPSAVRACVMVGFTLLAPLVGRENDILTSLSGALLLILLGNPYAVASVSLQLSFAAVAGLLLLAPGILSFLDQYCPGPGGPVRSFLLGTAAASLGVMATTAPLSAVYFGALSLVSPLSNILVLWAVPVLFALALVLTVVFMICPGAAFLAAVLETLAEYVLGAAGLMTALPGHCVYFTGVSIALWMVLVYVMLAVCALSRDRRRKYALALILAAVSLGAAKAVPMLGVRDDALTVVAVDVGQGAATLLHSEGAAALVDCGSLGSSTAPGTAAANAMDAYGWERMDYIALTHYHEDHAGGLESLLARVEVGELLLPQLSGSEDQGSLQQEVLALAERYGVPVRYVEAPVEIALGGATLRAYPPLGEGDANEAGLTVLCSAGKFDILMTGDMSAETERVLVERYALPDIEVLAVGHHGSRNSTSEELLAAVTPEVGIISVGAGNTFGHPTEEAMARMRTAGMEIYRTDLQGNILIRVHHGGS